MIDTMQSGEKIEKWIKETLSKPHETFNNLPACPFAKKAWLENKVEIHEDRNLYEIDFKRLLTGELDVIMFLLEPTIDVDEFDRQVNLTKAVVKDKYIVLDDHPQHEEKVSGFKLNLKDYAAIFVQSREKLEKARASLVIQGYYKNFTEDYLLDVWSN